MKHRTLVLLLALGLLTGLAARLSRQPASRDPETPNALRLLAAVQSYTAACRAEGRPVPESIPLQELVDRGLLSTGDLGPFAGREVRIYPKANEARPQDPLAEVRFPDGHTVVALADGSVQSTRSR